jgi:ParB family chromosome partitioning protein
VRVHPSIPNAYELVAGERRWRASQQAKLHEVPVLIRDLSDRDALEIALVENLQRQDLSPIEEAEAFARLMEEFRHTQEELAKAVGKSRSHVANTLRLLALPDKVRKLVADGKLSAGHARALIGIDCAEDMAADIIDRGLNVRQVEALAQRSKQPASDKSLRGARGSDPDIAALERELAVALGLKVRIRHRGPGGELSLAYESLDQFDALVGRLR